MKALKSIAAGIATLKEIIAEVSLLDLLKFVIAAIGGLLGIILLGIASLVVPILQLMVVFLIPGFVIFLFYLLFHYLFG